MKKPKSRQSNVSRETNIEKIAIDTGERVERWLAETTLSPRAGFLDRIKKMAATLALWGAHTNLTADPTNPAEIAFHVVDSLAPITYAASPNRETLEAVLADGQSVFDLGSGAGFPGLVLAAAFEARFTLAEARRKRASYLQVAAYEMGLENVAIEYRRAGQGSKSNLSKPYDLATVRAVGVSIELHEIAAAVLRPGGIFLLYASADQILDVLADATPGAPIDDFHTRFSERAEWTYRLPHGERVVTRTAVLFRKSPSA